jgi:hypothetical protein
MSRSLFITCQDCKERLWIGQGMGSFYSGEPETMDALGKFLFKHETTPTTEHVLNYRDDNSTDDWYNDDSWKEVKPNKEG